MSNTNESERQPDVLPDRENGHDSSSPREHITPPDGYSLAEEKLSQRPKRTPANPHEAWAKLTAEPTGFAAVRSTDSDPTAEPRHSIRLPIAKEATLSLRDVHVVEKIASKAKGLVQLQGASLIPEADQESVISTRESATAAKATSNTHAPDTNK